MTTGYRTLYLETIEVRNKRADAIARRLNPAQINLLSRVCNHVLFDLSEGREVREWSATKNPDQNGLVNVRAQLTAMGIDPDLPAADLNRAVLAKKQSLRRAAKLLRAGFFEVMKAA